MLSVSTFCIARKCRRTISPNPSNPHSIHLVEYHLHLAIFQQVLSDLCQIPDFPRRPYLHHFVEASHQVDTWARVPVSSSPTPRTGRARQYPRHSHLLYSEAPSGLRLVFEMLGSLVIWAFAMRRIGCCRSEECGRRWLKARRARLLSQISFDQ